MDSRGSEDHASPDELRKPAILCSKMPSTYASEYWSRPDLQPVVDRRVEHVDGELRIDVGSQISLPNPCFDRQPGHAPPGKNPALQKSLCQLRVELGLPQQVG
jgi:hypothetical protein